MIDLTAGAKPAAWESSQSRSICSTYAHLALLDCFHLACMRIGGGSKKIPLRAVRRDANAMPCHARFVAAAVLLTLFCFLTHKECDFNKKSGRFEKNQKMNRVGIGR